MSSKPPFQNINGRRPFAQRPVPETPHMEYVRYIQSAWRNVVREMEMSKNCSADGKGPNITYYSSNMPDEEPSCTGFKRFDLDAFIEQRLLAHQATKQSASAVTAAHQQ